MISRLRKIKNLDKNFFSSEIWEPMLGGALRGGWNSDDGQFQL